MLNWLTKIYDSLKSFKFIFAPLFFVLSVIASFVDFMHETWVMLFAKVDALVIGAIPGVDFSPLALINYCFPIDTLLTLTVSYGGILALCAVIRIIKSFVPTIA